VPAEPPQAGVDPIEGRDPLLLGFSLEGMQDVDPVGKSRDEGDAKVLADLNSNLIDADPHGRHGTPVVWLICSRRN
jgi:hypothetical protein